MNIIGKRKIYYGISVVLTIASIFALVAWGLELDIDFKGGSTLEINYPDGNRPEMGKFSEILSPVGLSDIKVSPVGDNRVVLRFKETDEAAHQNIIKVLKDNSEKTGIKMEESRFSAIGPVIGAELKQKAVQAVIMVLLGISIYIAWAFRKVSKPISSWRYGIATLVALFHDIAIPLGLFAYLGHFYGVEIGTNFIVALLVVLGFSVHDTIVVFDRIRENLKQHSELDFTTIVDRSVNETLIRSINTSVTVLLTLAALYVFGGESLKYFILTLIVGIISGTYSSIFLASPILVSWYGSLKKRKRI